MNPAYYYICLGEPQTLTEQDKEDFLMASGAKSIAPWCLWLLDLEQTKDVEMV